MYSQGPTTSPLDADQRYSTDQLCAEIVGITHQPRA
jgi:hypothetical protein